MPAVALDPDIAHVHLRQRPSPAPDVDTPADLAGLDVYLDLALLLAGSSVFLFNATIPPGWVAGVRRLAYTIV